jgi:Uma2 family endonuclease
MPTLTPTRDQHLVLGDRTWEQFKLIECGFSGSPGIRLMYYQNTIEILMPGEEHEFFKTIIGFLLELYCLDTGIEFIPAGSMTQAQAGIVSLQADEAYWFGEKKAVPDLAIEVVFASGGVEKLARYAVLGVPEVWFWEDGVLSVYCYRNDGYESMEISSLAPLAGLDIEHFSRCILAAQTSRLEAAQLFRRGA